MDDADRPRAALGAIVAPLGRRVLARQVAMGGAGGRRLGAAVLERRRPKRIEAVRRLFAQRPPRTGGEPVRDDDVPVPRPAGMSEFAARWLFADGPAEGIAFSESEPLPVELHSLEPPLPQEPAASPPSPEPTVEREQVGRARRLRSAPVPRGTIEEGRMLRLARKPVASRDAARPRAGAPAPARDEQAPAQAGPAKHDDPPPIGSADQPLPAPQSAQGPQSAPSPRQEARPASDPPPPGDAPQAPAPAPPQARAPAPRDAPPPSEVAASADERRTRVRVHRVAPAATERRPAARLHRVPRPRTQARAELGVRADGEPAPARTGARQPERPHADGPQSRAHDSPWRRLLDVLGLGTNARLARGNDWPVAAVTHPSQVSPTPRPRILAASSRALTKGAALASRSGAPERDTGESTDDEPARGDPSSEPGGGRHEPVEPASLTQPEPPSLAPRSPVATAPHLTPGAPEKRPARLQLRPRPQHRRAGVATAPASRSFATAAARVAGATGAALERDGEERMVVNFSPPGSEAAGIAGGTAPAAAAPRAAALLATERPLLRAIAPPALPAAAPMPEPVRASDDAAGTAIDDLYDELVERLRRDLIAERERMGDIIGELP